MEKMLGNNNYYRHIFIGIVLFFFLCSSTKALEYTEVLNEKEVQSAAYLKALYVERSSCLVDAATLAVEFVFDVRYGKDLQEQSSVAKISTRCLEQEKLNMTRELLVLQYSICASLLEPVKIDKIKCEELGKTPTSTGKTYGVLSDDEPATLWKIVTTNTPTGSAKGVDVYVPELKNPMSLLRSALAKESTDYQTALITLQDILVKQGDASSAVMNSKLMEQEKQQASLTIVGTLEWFQQFYFAYPQHQIYRNLLHKIEGTMQVIHTIARIFEQLRYTLPNSSVDGDGLK